MPRKFLDAEEPANPLAERSEPNTGARASTMTPQIGDVFQFFKEQCTELPQFSFFHGSFTEPKNESIVFFR